MITKGLVGVIFFLSVMLTFFYMSNLKLKNDLQVAIIQVEAAETSLRTAQQEAELAAVQLEQFNAKMQIIVEERNESRAQVDRMRDLFQDHDFAKLLTKKPGLIENLMIKKTEEVFSEI